MNRREFFRALGVGVGVAAIAPKLVPTPTPPPTQSYCIAGWVSTLEGYMAYEYETPGISKSFEEDWWEEDEE